MGAGMAFLLSAALGANDVANSLGTSVGTGAISLRQALTIGALMEFAGAVLFGSTVTKTISSGVVTIGATALASPSSFMMGMVAVLFGCFLWMAIATRFGLPVSSTHSVVGSLIGVGAVCGWGINYSAVLNILLSWIVSPVIGGFLAFVLYNVLKRTILNSASPAASAKKYLPFLSFVTMTVLSSFLLSKALASLVPRERIPLVGMGTGLIAAVVSATLARNWVHADVSQEQQRQEVEEMFKIMQVLTACLVAFSHGSNDVSNAIGPFAAIWGMKTGSLLTGNVTSPIWVLVMGGLGISLGLSVFGKPVMETVGKKIIPLVPTNGFCVELSTALTVLLASELGLPVSTTHTLIGCIVAIGIATGNRSAVNVKVLGNIALSWGVTVPVSALLTVLCYWFARPLLG